MADADDTSVHFPQAGGNFADRPASEGHPGTNGTVAYDEGIAVGYRFYDAVSRS